MENFFISIFSGFIGSLLVVLFLYHLRPNIKISTEIAKNTDTDGTVFYNFKIINRTPYPVIDFKLELLLVTPNSSPNTANDHLRILSTLERFQIDSARNPSEEEGNVLIFSYPGKLEDHWGDSNQHIVLSVIAKHGLSQFSRVISQKYYGKSNSIIPGEFLSGESLSVA